MFTITSQQLTALLLAGLFVFACNTNPKQFQTENNPPNNLQQTATVLKTDTTVASAVVLPQTPANTTGGEQRQLPDVPKTPAAILSQPDIPVHTGEKGQMQYEFPWLATPATDADALQHRITLPVGFHRIAAAPGSFAHYLRQLPLKPGKPPVLLFDGSPKYNQNAHTAVFNIDPGTEDLQQCADAIMRLRAEYLWATKQYTAIHFNFTSGHTARYSQWQQGYRPVISGNKVSWQQQASPKNSVSYASFRQYLKQVFTYAGTLSLSKELQVVTNQNHIAPGDVFIKGGSPGHAVIVVDVAQNEAGQKIFLLAQSYMPAQEIHLLQNPGNPHLSPWYTASFTGDLVTPEWTFAPNSLKRFE